MKKDLHLTASVDKPEVLENIIEQLAVLRYDIGYGNTALPAPWKALSTSCVESYVSGSVEFDYTDTQRIRSPYITCFLFGCIKEKTNHYHLEWGISLS